MSKVEERYPLPDAERRLLMQQMLLNEALFICLGLVIAAVVGFAGSLDVLGTLTGRTWVGSLLATLHLSWPPLAVAAAVIVVLQVAGWLMYGRVAAWTQALDESRQGLTGELVRLPLWFVVPIMLCTGVAEELLFRYALIELFALIAGVFMPLGLACVVALIASTLVFTLAHVQYKRPINIATVFIVGLLLGIGYLLSHSLLSLMIAHAAYDIVEVLVERRQMLREDDYFKGKIPVDYIGRLMEERAKSTRP